MDSLGCGMLALRFGQCTRLLGPVVPGATPIALGSPITVTLTLWNGTAARITIQSPKMPLGLLNTPSESRMEERP